MAEVKKRSAKKTAAKKSSAKKSASEAAAKKSPARKSSSKGAKKVSSARKTAAKKSTARKAAAKKPATKKVSPKKSAPKKKVAGRLRITQTRSPIGRPAKQKATLRALGLRKIRHSVEHKDTPVIRGMVARVIHLVKVEEVQARAVEEG